MGMPLTATTIIKNIVTATLLWYDMVGKGKSIFLMKGALFYDRAA